MNTNNSKRKHGFAYRVLGSFWAFDESQAVDIGAEKISDLSHRSLYFYKNDRLLREFVKLIKKDSFLRFFKLDLKIVRRYFAAIDDLFKKPVFRDKFIFQIKNKRSMHGIRLAVPKHIWSVSLMLFYLNRNRKDAAAYARAGLLHDICLKGTIDSYVADFKHPVRGSDLCRKLGEKQVVIDAVEDHLFPNIIRFRRLPRSHLGWQLLAVDIILACFERMTSIWLKISKRRVGEIK